MRYFDKNLKSCAAAVSMALYTPSKDRVPGGMECYAGWGFVRAPSHAYVGQMLANERILPLSFPWHRDVHL